MTSAILIALVGFMYFAVAVDQAFVQHNFWNGLVWLGYAYRPDRSMAHHCSALTL